MQIAYFLIGFVGFQLLGVFLAVIFQSAYIAGHPDATLADLTEWSTSLGPSFLLQALAYSILLLVFALIIVLSKRLPRFIESFKSWKPFVFGLIGAGVILGINELYSLMISGIFSWAGYAPPEVNHNEQLIRDFCVAYPAASLFVFGIIGPICEEIGYRVGLFSFLCRAGKVIGYVGSALIFGFIHFNWSALFDPTLHASLPMEFANIPGYIGAGLALAFLYDRFGLASSLTAHTLNNLISLTVTIIGGANHA